MYSYLFKHMLHFLKEMPLYRQEFAEYDVLILCESYCLVVFPCVPGLLKRSSHSLMGRGNPKQEYVIYCISSVTINFCKIFIRINIYLRNYTDLNISKLVLMDAANLSIHETL